MAPSPRVSIVTATYNRSHILRHAIGCTLRSRETDWELIVVGDACTDDTAEVVKSFGDPRIRFHNLPENHGEQSRPNNVGCDMARGRYLAFLNHDDLWFPWHLSTLCDLVEQADADMAVGLGIVLYPDAPAALVGVTPTTAYEPQVFCPASSWVLRHELLERVGPWRSFRETYTSPSQEWIHRAWKRGARIRVAGSVTWVGIQSGVRAGSYLSRDDSEHRAAARAMADDPSFLEQQLLGAARRACADTADLGLWPPARRLARNTVYRIAMACGRPPSAGSELLRRGRKGALIDHLRRVRGLPPLP